jgi:prepilin peptidase CpaA
MSVEPDNAVVPLGSAQRAEGFARPTLPWLHVWAILLALAATGTVTSTVASSGKAAGLFIPLLTFVVCLLAAWYDSATERIPNPLTYTAILLGVGINCVATIPALAGTGHWLGTAGTVESLMGFGLCTSIGLVCMALAGMGGGDMKLLSAVGALLGLSQSVDVLVAALVVGIIYSLINLVLAGRLNRVVSLLSFHLLELVYLKRTDAVATTSKHDIPAAVPLLLGLVITRMGLALRWNFWPFGTGGHIG